MVAWLKHFVRIAFGYFFNLTLAISARFSQVRAGTRSVALEQEQWIEALSSMDAGSFDRVLSRLESGTVRWFSQNGEDSIILALLSRIGFGARRCVEISCGVGWECCTANLIVYHGFDGLLIDGSKSNCNLTEGFFRALVETRLRRPAVVQRWVTADNVVGTVVEAGYGEGIDVLVVDIDGNDYWILRSLLSLHPRVVVVEFNNSVPPGRALTIPYDPSFVAEFGQFGPDYAGASLDAFNDLCSAEGYDLVAVERQGFNAFFVRRDAALAGALRSVAPVSVKRLFTTFSIASRWPGVAGRAWVSPEPRPGNAHRGGTTETSTNRGTADG